MKKDSKKNNEKDNKKKNMEEETIVLEKISDNSRSGVSDYFYYLLALIISLVLIFSTEELLSAINYLFVVIFAIVAVVLIINFIMNKEYEIKTYTNMAGGIIFIWLAIFIFQYGNFLFLEMLPILLSLLLFLMGISSLVKYFDFKKNGNLVVTVISLLLGISLIFIPRGIMYLFFKIVGVYILVMVILDFIDYKKNSSKKVE